MGVGMGVGMGKMMDGMMEKMGVLKFKDFYLLLMWFFELFEEKCEEVLIKVVG